MRKKRDFLKKISVFVALLLSIITVIGQPINDNFENAIDITHLINSCSADKAFTNAKATFDETPGSCWTAQEKLEENIRNVWFKFTAPATGQINIELKTRGDFGKIQYVEMALWDNTGINELKCAKYTSATGGVEISSLGLTPGAVYYISVNNSGTSGHSGTFTLCLQDKVSYDYFEGAKDITHLMNNCSEPNEYSNAQASMDRNNADCWKNPGGYNVWFSFVAPSDFIEIELQRGSIQYAMMALWEDDGTTQLACEPSAGKDNVYITKTNLTPGNTYYLSVNSVTTGKGTFSLCIKKQPFFSINDGDWHDPNSWSNSGFSGMPSGKVPGEDDMVYIKDHIITISNNISIKCLRVTADEGNTKLIINSDITIDENITFSNTPNASIGDIIINENGRLTINQDFVLERNNGDKSLQIQIEKDGVLETLGDFKITTSGGTDEENKIMLNDDAQIIVFKDFILENASGVKSIIKANDNATITVLRDFIVNSSHSNAVEIQFNDNSNLRLSGDLLRTHSYGSITFADNANLYLVGTLNSQIISGNASVGGENFTYQNIYVNNISPSNYILLNEDIDIYGSLNLFNGIIRTHNSNDLLLRQGASVNLGNENSYIDGPFKYELVANNSTEINLPIGKEDDWRPAKLYVKHTTNDVYTYKAELFKEDANSLEWALPPNVSHVSRKYWWEIKRYNESGIEEPSANLDGTQSIALYYGDNDGIVEPEYLTIVKSSPTIPNTWIDIGGVEVGDNSILSTSAVGSLFDSFSYFTLANTGSGDNPLPIELTNFKAENKNNIVEITWTTASEKNNDYFEIEKSKDGIFFTPIAKIDGHGNSLATHHYFAEDTQPYCGISYYRLKQVDYDGTITTHPIVTVNKAIDRNIFIYPIPASHVLHYTVSPELVGATAILVDVLGKEIKNNIIISNEKGHIYVDDVPSGTYQLRMFTDEVQQNIKIQINN